MNPLIPLLVVVPLAAAFLIMILGRFIRHFDRYFASLILLFLVMISFYFLFVTGDKMSVYKVGGWEPVDRLPIGIYMVLDGFTAIILCIINLIGFLSVFYSISYISRYTSENYFYALFCLMIAGMNGVVLSGDLFNIFVFLEISAISSYALVAFGVEKNELEATFKYQVLGGIASFLILFGIAFIYWKAKTLNIADIKMAFSSGYDKRYYILVQILMLSGFGLKAAIIPFHAWLPDAHSSAPSPISAMLSGVLIKAVGIYVIIRLFFNMFDITEGMAVLITTLGALSMVVGVFLAIGQWDIKRLLAYHSISQMGYVILSVGIGMILVSRGGSPEIASLAIAGGVFHLINHAAFKSLLFLNAGAIEYSTGTRDLREMGGLSKSMPVTSATSFVASLSISGIPPFNGFFSKLIIIIAAVMAHLYLLAALAAIVSIITLASFLKFQRYAFYNKDPDKKWINVREVPFPMVFSMIVLAIICLLLSLLVFPGIRETILSPATEILMDPSKYSSQIIGL
ncbi:MAG TPA: monovalent cation/H+ antiporter subunit D family protein [Bacteroidales bacterium]|nr:monovalent cation/H+ antiporter subunit D family protein [Bacteroidales bacterium]